MFKRKISDVNLIIINDNLNQHDDDLTFLTWFSFNKNFSGIKSLIIRKKRNQSNINYWSNSFGIFCMTGDYHFEKIKNFNFLDKNYFIVKSGIISSKSELDLDKSFDLYENCGVFYKNKTTDLLNDQNDLFGNLNSDASTIFINLNSWIKELVDSNLNTRLSQCYGNPKFLKGHGTANEINFGYILKDAYSLYANFPEVLNG